jgi:predicted ATPase
MHLKGYAASDTVAALKQAQSLIEGAKALNESPGDSLQLFSILHGMWATNRVAFNGGAMRQLSAQFLALAEKQTADTMALMNGHRVVGISLLLTGDISDGRAHLNKAVALYKPTEHGPMATRFGADVAISVLSYRAVALWLLGYPASAQADINRLLLRARDLGQAASLMFALCHTSLIHIHVGNYEAALADADECISLAENKNSPFWKALASLMRACLLSLGGSDFDAIKAITQGIAALRSTGSTGFLPMFLSYLATAHARLNEIDEASCAIGEAITAAASTMEIWCDAEILRVSGEMDLARGNSDKAQKYFERALAIARQQQAKSWELRASMSLARLWRDQGKPRQARELLAPVYGWFAEGFDTRDLKQAKAVLEKLAI